MKVASALEGLRSLYNISFQQHLRLGMGIVENSTVRFGSVLVFASTVRFYHGFLNGLLMTFLGYETTQWNAWLNLPELESSYILAPWPLSLRSESF